MADDFNERLVTAREAGKLAAKRSGQTVKALTLQAMDDGADDSLGILVDVLERRGELPGWLRSAPRHELDVVLSAWGSVRHAMREHGKAIIKTEQADG